MNAEREGGHDFENSCIAPYIILMFGFLKPQWFFTSSVMKDEFPGALLISISREWGLASPDRGLISWLVRDKYTIR